MFVVHELQHVGITFLLSVMLNGYIQSPLFIVWEFPSVLMKVQALVVFLFSGFYFFLFLFFIIHLLIIINEKSHGSLASCA